MSRTVYAISSHTNPDQVARLVNVIAAGSRQAVILVHHDQTRSYLDAQWFNELPNVHVCRTNPAWRGETSR